MREETAQLAQWLLQIQREGQAPNSAALPRYLAASDLHGNISRLREILATAQRQGINHIYLVGDLYAGAGGWSVFRTLQGLVPADEATSAPVTLMWGNHELAFVAGMLGNDRQLRFFHNYGGQSILRELNEERARRGADPVTLSSTARISAADLALLRAQPELQEQARWIQRTHCVFAVDAYGTGYLHAFPKIHHHGHFVFEYRGQRGWPALPLIDQDLRTADRANHPVFSMLLQTETSPLWALFEITSARQFDQAVRSWGVRQIVFGHRHHSEAVNVGNLNRQIGIAVDFDQGGGGYLIIGAQGLTYYRFVDRASQVVVAADLIVPAANRTAAATHLEDVQEFLFRQLMKREQEQFSQWPLHSAQARQEFESLERLREEGLPWVHRLYAELHTHVKDRDLRADMLEAAVQSGDEEAFRSFIHRLHDNVFELESFRTEWFGERYGLAKTVVQVLMSALRDMPVSRLGLLDIRVRGTTSRLNLTELYKRILELEDPELALLAVQNLGILRTAEADQQLRRAFFHNVRKVRVRAAETLAGHGEVAYPLVAPLLKSRDNWVRYLALWTLAELSWNNQARWQACHDIRRLLAQESDWFVYVTGKELLRKLRDPGWSDFPDRPEIPNLTDDILRTLQEIVDSEQEPFRRLFKVYFITIELSSFVYRRGLIGLDIDDLRIYVNNDDYFPPYYRLYKSGDLDMNGVWRGWRRLWIRGETPNIPDGPQVVRWDPHAAADCPQGPRTMVLYDHRHSPGRVALPDLDEVIARHGLGKVKDRVRHEMLQQWHSAFPVEEQVLLCRLHAAALRKMLFELPAELQLTAPEWQQLIDLSNGALIAPGTKDKRVLKLTGTTGRSRTAYPQWLDSPKYSVHVELMEDPQGREPSG